MKDRDGSLRLEVSECNPYWADQRGRGNNQPEWLVELRELVQREAAVDQLPSPGKQRHRFRNPPPVHPSHCPFGITTLTQQISKRQKQHSSLSGLNSLWLTSLEKTELQSYKPTYPYPPLPHPSDEPGRGSWDTLNLHGWWLLVPGKRHQKHTGQEPYDPPHPTGGGGTLKLTQPGHRKDAHLLREYMVFSMAEAILLQRDPRSPSSAGRKKENLVFNTSYWKSKEIFLLINLLNCYEAIALRRVSFP